MKCDSQASLLAHTFANPCFGHEPKARVAKQSQNPQHQMCVFLPFLIFLFTFFQLFDFTLQVSIVFYLKAISILEAF
jgi:hypothetical protein